MMCISFWLAYSFVNTEPFEHLYMLYMYITAYLNMNRVD
jgi:hypothetical protein